MKINSVIKNNLQISDFGIDRMKVLLSKGYKLARKSWNGKNLHVELCPGHYVGKMWLNDIIVIKQEGSDVANSWVPSMSDFLANDWFIVK